MYSVCSSAMSRLLLGVFYPPLWITYNQPAPLQTPTVLMCLSDHYKGFATGDPNGTSVAGQFSGKSFANAVKLVRLVGMPIVYIAAKNNIT
jgi:hypothetical protein